MLPFLRRTQHWPPEVLPASVAVRVVGDPVPARHWPRGEVLGGLDQSRGETVVQHHGEPGPAYSLSVFPSLTGCRLVLTRAGEPSG